MKKIFESELRSVISAIVERERRNGVKRYWAISSWLVLAAILLTAPPAGALPRGKPGTEERKTWCADQRASCLEDGYKNCEEKYKGGDALTACKIQTYDLCRITFGSNSRCQTQEMKVPGATTPTRPVKPTRPDIPGTSPKVKVAPQ